MTTGNFLIDFTFNNQCDGINHNAYLFASDDEWLVESGTSDFQVICTAQKQTIVFQTPTAQHIIHLSRATKFA